MDGNAFGRPRRGRPKTDAERRATHKAVYGNTKLPERGARMEVLKKMSKNK